MSQRARMRQKGFLTRWLGARSAAPSYLETALRQARYEIEAYERLYEQAIDRHRHTSVAFWSGGAPRDSSRVYWQAKLEALHRLQAERPA